MDKIILGSHTFYLFDRSIYGSDNDKFSVSIIKMNDEILSILSGNVKTERYSDVIGASNKILLGSYGTKKDSRSTQPS